MNTVEKGIDRETLLARGVAPDQVWDFVIIGGGATGAGIAMDAAARGFSVLLLEGHDFGKGTSSRSTKLIHGGVRYLEQFQIHMVRESLRERGRLLVNAPEIVHELEFIIPCTRAFDRFFYGVGLKVYDCLAFGSKTKHSKQVSRATLYQRLPGLVPNKFVGGVSYSDGQFDDTRLLIETVRQAIKLGACCLNYAPVTSVRKDESGRVQGVSFRDAETNQTYDVRGKVVINATGPFCDAIRQMDKPGQKPLVAASQGVHLVLAPSFFQAESALIVPKTSDGRVLFIIPWHGHVLVGTTDTAIDAPSAEPRPFPEEMTFLLDTIEEYCGRRPLPEECLSVFTGIRPLVKGSPNQATKKLSRDHTIEISDSKLLTITGGKWTTYRHMAEDCVNQAIAAYGLPQLPCKTLEMRLVPAPSEQVPIPSEIAWPLTEQSSLKNVIHFGDLIRAIRHEHARTVEDVLARRTRALFLNAKEAMELAPIAAKLLAKEHGRGLEWIELQIASFRELAEGYDPRTYWDISK